MKRLITASLCLSIIFFPLEKVKSQAAPAICLVIVAGIAITGIWIIVRSCRHKWYCIYDKEYNRQWCQTLSRGELNDMAWELVSGPYNEAEKCIENCPTNHTTKIAGEVDPSTGTDIIHFEMSTNLLTWREIGVVTGAIDDFEFSYTNSINMSKCFIRAWY